MVELRLPVEHMFNVVVVSSCPDGKPGVKIFAKLDLKLALNGKYDNC